MTPVMFAGTVFVCAFGGSLLGVQLRGVLPAHHFDGDSRDTMKLSMGLIATMTALVLGLITASAKSAFEDVDSGMQTAVVDLLTLDRTLARYGEESRPVREHLRHIVGARIDAVWPTAGAALVDPLSSTAATNAERLAEEVRRLEPRDESQAALRDRALELVETLLRERWLVVLGPAPSVPLPFLVILAFWLTITFLSFGLFASRNATVLSALFVCALTVASAVFLVLELDDPFRGIVAISPDVLHYAHARIGQ